MRLSRITVFLAILLASVSHAQETEVQEPRRNPYRELGSRFEFSKTGDPLVDWNPIRDWTDTQGRVIKAKIIGVKDGQANLLLAGNKVSLLSLERLSKKDQRFVAEWQEIAVYFNTGYQKSRDVTNSVEAEIGDGDNAKAGKVHETRNFRFISDQPLNATTVKDFSRMFEATYATVRALPLGIEVAQPKDGKFQVRLFSDKEDYYQAGGPPTSAGVYVLKSREILVPFESLGLSKAGNTYRKVGKSNTSTLVHEITHAVTHQWLNYMPMWVAEGLADYVAAIPYENEAFRFNQHAEGLYRMVKFNFGGDEMRFRILRPEEFVYLDQDEFMNRPSEAEKSIDLVAIEPYQIRLRSEGDPSPDAESKKPASKSTDGPAMGNGITPQVVENASSIVVQRYSSSMLLLHALISGGQTENLRKYLFANLDFNWDADKYIDDYNQNLNQYQGAVKKQIADFDEQLRKFNEAIHAYNSAVKLRNAGGDVALPPVPKNPAVPGAIEVPQILSQPRSRDEFSHAVFRKNSVKTYLLLPENLGL